MQSACSTRFNYRAARELVSDRRLAILRELVRIARPGGRILVQAWAQEQGTLGGHSGCAPDETQGEDARGGDERRFDFESASSQDVFVPW